MAGQLPSQAAAPTLPQHPYPQAAHEQHASNMPHSRQTCRLRKASEQSEHAAAAHGAGWERSSQPVTPRWEGRGSCTGLTWGPGRGAARPRPCARTSALPSTPPNWTAGQAPCEQAPAPAPAHTHTHAHARLSQHGRCTRRPKACKAGQLLQLGTASLSTQLHLRHVGLKCLGCICTSPHAHIHAHACAHASSHMLAQARTGVNICTCPFMERHTHTCADTLEEQKDLHRHTLTYAGMHARIDNCAHTETQTCSCTQGKLKACFRSRMD